MNGGLLGFLFIAVFWPLAALAGILWGKVYNRWIERQFEAAAPIGKVRLRLLEGEE